MKVKPAKLLVPAGEVTLTEPLALPTAGVAVICVAETTVNDAAFTPPNCTWVAPVKLVPVMVTTIAGPAVVGVKPVTASGINEKPANVPVPPGAVTLTEPLTAVKGTVAVI